MKKQITPQGYHSLTKTCYKRFISTGMGQTLSLVYFEKNKWLPRRQLRLT